MGRRGAHFGVMTETEAVALAEARNRMPGGGRWFAQRIGEREWRVVRVLSDGATEPPGEAWLRRGPQDGLDWDVTRRAGA
jgi:hypothetical protein